MASLHYLVNFSNKIVALESSVYASDLFAFGRIKFSVAGIYSQKDIRFYLVYFFWPVQTVLMTRVSKPFVETDEKWRPVSFVKYKKHAGAFSRFLSDPVSTPKLCLRHAGNYIVHKGLLPPFPARNLMEPIVNELLIGGIKLNNDGLKLKLARACKFKLAIC